MQLEFSFVTSELRDILETKWYTIPNQTMEWSCFDTIVTDKIVIAQQMTADTVNNFLWSESVKMNEETTAQWAVILRFTYQFLKQSNKTIHELVEEYLSPLPDFMSQLEIEVFPLSNTLAVDVRIVSSIAHEKLYWISEGAEIPRANLTNWPSS